MAFGLPYPCNYVLKMFQLFQNFWTISNLVESKSSLPLDWPIVVATDIAENIDSHKNI